MAGIEEQLRALLDNPAEMARMAEMASRLMGSISPSAAAPAPPAAGGMDPALTGLVQRIAGGLGGGGQKKELLQAMSPYLAEKRQRRLEKALRYAAAARLAGAAFSEMGGGEG